jgi:hypothetical protein
MAAESLMPLRGRLARHLVLLLDQEVPGSAGADLALNMPLQTPAGMLATIRHMLNRE